MPHYPGSPYQVVKQFEEALSWYTGAPYVVATESCTNAIYIACKHLIEYKPGWRTSIQIPGQTYVGVPMAIQHAGLRLQFRQETWRGKYQLWPTNIWDCARRLTKGMYVPGEVQCLSFHWEKILGIGRGGAILTDDAKAAEWYRRARFDGRQEGVTPWEDPFQWGIHAYMIPEMAAAGLIRLWFLPEHNPDQENDYPDLSQKEIFQS